jgi:hypothetical protein
MKKELGGEIMKKKFVEIKKVIKKTYIFAH